jgi:hypothetical protein
MPKVLVAIIASLLVACCLIASLLRTSTGLQVTPTVNEKGFAASGEIQVFVAASNRSVIEEISRKSSCSMNHCGRWMIPREKIFRTSSEKRIDRPV